MQTFTRFPSFETRSIVIILSTVFLWSSCSEKHSDILEPEPVKDQTASCVGCHTNYAVLKTVASADTAASGGGCGGDAPHIEPYDRVFMGGDGFLTFKTSTHGKMPCTTCHGGKDSTSNKSLAHSGGFLKNPSADAATTCGTCHGVVNMGFANSLHAQGLGQKTMVALRAGYSSFDQMTEQLKQGYNTNCAKCHATCGDCHVNRPKAGGGGLYKGHEFRRVPNMTDQCVACHTSRGGHAFFGIGAGTVPDVHLAKLGSCLSCHSGAELHGNGLEYDQRYKMPALPTCANCHRSIETSNAYHATHINTLNCQACHSQNYNNCGSCHVAGEGARIPSYMGFKLALNPIAGTRPYKIVTVRRSLTAPDSWKEYGMSTLANFDVSPTYKYATPHNLLRWTTRTKVGSGRSCYDNCHIIQENGVYRNKELYLFKSDLQNWELSADANIVMDGKLPATWGQQFAITRNKPR